MPLAIDLFCGLGGWTDGLLAEGWDVIGFDIEQHAYGDHRYPGMLCIQDVLTLHGSQFRNAHLIVASPPCQEYSYMAMPWTLAKAKAAAIRADETGAELERLNRLFNACFRIQREACEAAGRHIPMVVENVRGAIPWVGRSRWNFGSFHLWGDVPALMPMTLKASKVPNFRFDSFQSASVAETGTKNPGLNWSKHAEPDYRTSGAGACFRDTAIKNSGGSWFNIGSPGQKVVGQNPDGRKTRGHPNIRDGHTHSRHLTNPAEHEITQADVYRESLVDGLMDPAAHANGTKQPISGHAWYREGCGAVSSKSTARKAASAMIAKIPLTLARHIGATFRPPKARSA